MKKDRVALVAAVTVLVGGVCVNYDQPSGMLALSQCETIGAEADGPKIESKDPPSRRSEHEGTTIARGTVVGTVVAKGRQWLKVRSVSGKTERYLEHWEGGRKVTTGNSSVKVGDRVSVKWTLDAYPRMIVVTKIGAGESKGMAEAEGDSAGTQKEIRKLIDESGRLWKEYLAAKERGEQGKAEKLKQRSIKAEERAHELRRKLKKARK